MISSSWLVESNVPSPKFQKLSQYALSWTGVQEKGEGLPGALANLLGQFLGLWTDTKMSPGTVLEHFTVELQSWANIRLILFYFK